VQPAPQPPQVRAMPPPGETPQGYVLPEPGELPPKKVVPIHPDVYDARRKMLEQPGNQYIRQRGEAVIQLREQQRQQEQALIDEDYKAKQIQNRELTKLYHEQKASAPKRGLEEAKARQDLEGEGFRPITPEQAKSVLPMGGQLPAGQSVWQNRRGELKFGPTPPASTTVNIDQKQETAEASKRGSLAAEREGKLFESATNSGSALLTLNRAEALHDQIATGKTTPTRMTIGAYGKSMGVADETLIKMGLDPKAVGSQQAFNAIVNELTIGKLGAGGFPSNNFSNTDRSFLTDTVPSLGDDPESNRIKIGAAKLVARRDLEKAQEWAAFRNDPANAGAKGEKPSFSDFEAHWINKVNKQDATGELRKQAEGVLEKAKKSDQNQPQDQEDIQALRWLRANPNHPRAGEVRQKLGL
jgi:hypothetical protein